MTAELPFVFGYAPVECQTIEQIDAAMREASDELNSSILTSFNKPKPTKRIPVAVNVVEEWLRLVGGASRAVHSNAHMQTADKVPILSALAKVRKGLQDHIQLKLFDDTALDFDS